MRRYDDVDALLRREQGKRPKRQMVGMASPWKKGLAASVGIVGLSAMLSYCHSGGDNSALDSKYNKINLESTYYDSTIPAAHFDEADSCVTITLEEGDSPYAVAEDVVAGQYNLFNTSQYSVLDLARYIVELDRVQNSSESFLVSNQIELCLPDNIEY